jgi:excinuclease UvrABC ATPase subunit
VSDSIRIRGARQHNLRDLDLDLPRGKLIAFTGVSGSGKSSLAFDTIFAEGQRRYIESLSNYAKQFLQELPRPDVDEIEGLTPTIAVDQAARAVTTLARRSRRSPRSPITCAFSTRRSASLTARAAVSRSGRSRVMQSWRGSWRCPRARG